MAEYILPDRAVYKVGDGEECQLQGRLTALSVTRPIPETQTWGERDGVTLWLKTDSNPHMTQGTFGAIL